MSDKELLRYRDDSGHAPGLSFSPVREKLVRPVEGAQLDRLDLRGRHAGIQQLLAVGGLQIELPASALVRREHCITPGPGLIVRIHRLIDFVVAGSDGGADRDQDVPRACSESVSKHSYGFNRDAGARPLPPCVNRSNSAVARIGQEHRNTIGGMDGERQVSITGRHAIGPFDDAAGVCGDHDLDRRPMHLGGFHVTRRTEPKRIEDRRPIVGDVLGVIINPSTKIQ